MLCEHIYQTWIVVWRNSIPIFPECFILIILPITLLLITIAMFLPYLIYLRFRKRPRQRKLSIIFIWEFALLCVGLGASIAQLVVTLERCEVPMRVCSYMPSVSCVILLLVALIWNAERLRDAANSAVVFFTILFSAIVFGARGLNHLVFVFNPHFKLNNLAENFTSPKSNDSAIIDAQTFPWNSSIVQITDLICLLTFCGLFILSCQSERMIQYNALMKRQKKLVGKDYAAQKFKQHELKPIAEATEDRFEGEETEPTQPPCPEKYASFLSRVMYAWFVKLIIRGYRTPLEINDLWKLDEQHSAERVSNRFAEILKHHVQPEKPINYYKERRRISLLYGSTNNTLKHGEFSPDGRRATHTGNILEVKPRFDPDVDGRRASDGNWLYTPQLRSDPNVSSSPNIIAPTNNSIIEVKLPQDENGSITKSESASTPEYIAESRNAQNAVSHTGMDDPEVGFQGGAKRSSLRRSVRLNDGSINSPEGVNVGLDRNRTTRSSLHQHVMDGKKSPSPSLTRQSQLIDASETKSTSKGCCGCCLGFIRTLIGACWGRFIWTGFLKLLHDTMVFINPIMLKLLLKFMQAETPEPIWHGYVYACLMFIIAGVQTLILQRYFRDVNIIGMHLRTAVTSAVYKKSLRLSNAARQKSTTGQIMNLISADAQHFVQLMPYIHIVWSGPFQIIVAIVLLWNELGPAVLAGIAVLLLLLPVNVLVARWSKKLQEKKSKAADSRIKMITEILNGIRVIKLYAWEPSFIREVSQLREKEMYYLRKNTYLQSISFLWSSAPFLVALSSFGLYISLSETNILDAQKAFVSLSLFNILRFPLFMFPMITTSLVQSYVSCKRLDTFLRHTELNPDNCSHNDTPGVAAVIERGIFGWDPQEEPILQNISIHFPEGQLTLIMGTVGSGKSSLLHALLGEMELFNGRVNVKGSVAYVAQEPWVFNASLRENVLFLKPYDPVRYRRVIEACCLDADLAILPDGDLTEIGDKGINLSGGQKQRVSLARACYADADIYLLDDSLSAVDAHVGLHILNKVLSRSTGLLASKTCILTTHSPKALPFADRIVLLSQGQITEAGTYRQLLHSRTGHLNEFIQSIAHHDQNASAEATHTTSAANISITIDGTAVEEAQVIKRSASGRSQTSNHNAVDTQSHRQRTTSASSEYFRDNTSPYIYDSAVSLNDENINNKELPGEKPISKQQEPTRTGKNEAVQTGRVKWAVFKIYIRNMGLFYCLLILIAYPLTNLASLGTNLWLAEWSEDSKIESNLTEALKQNPDILINPNAYPEWNEALKASTERRNYRLGVYAALGFVQVFTAWVSVIAFAVGHLICAQKLHGLLLNGILHAPAGFFDRVPQGRVVNRFAQDVATMDGQLLTTMKSALTCFIHCFITLCVAASVNPWILIPICLLTALYLLLQNVYVTNSRQLKRIESAYRSPVFSHFSETLHGTSSIRAYGMTDKYIQINATRLDTHNSASYCSVLAQRWLAVLLESIANFIVLCVAMFCVGTRGTLSAGISGLVLSYALNLNQSLNWLVRMTADLENDIVCVERIEEYAKVESEAAWEVEDKMPPSTWPAGAIEFDHFGLRYRPELDLVLRSINFKINQGERIGIVGRTGSGKSSLVMGLFRMLEAAEGRILIDGLDIAQMGLHDLRRKLTLIPQDPILFSGTLRFNLDPFGQYSDEALWNALELANLKAFVKEVGNAQGLDMAITEGGSNISMGQRQLVCLARALLRRTPILVLDEATAAIDPITDNLIQETIRKEFSHCTVLTIAHRLNTIMDYDRIILLSHGQILEHGSPAQLLQDKNSNFHSLAKDAHLVE